MPLCEVFVPDNKLRIAELEKGFAICVATFGVDEQNEVHFFSNNLHQNIMFAFSLFYETTSDGQFKFVNFRDIEMRINCSD